YFLCLDEMTLQKVEIYFSEILSVMGGRRSKGQKIITDPILGAEAFGMDEESRVYYGDLTIPENLFMIGTISSEAVEEEISAKLLDQSSVIELGQPDLKLMPAPNATPKVMAWGSEFLKRDIFHLSTVTNHRKMIVEVITLLDAMNGILSKADAQIGFRVRDEICYYLYYNAEYGLMTQEAALDYAITQKLLPRISGNSSETENVLIDLFKICAGTQADTAIKTYSGEGGLFPHCANKLSQMDHAFNQTGKVSYWKNK
ncbi:MAG: DUF3578 domain-containing protein, partial [Eubacteriaceae bacterium]|nr:DUF3578 domain-containing protein [Eubacteriaceae bacterium]